MKVVFLGSALTFAFWAGWYLASIYWQASVISHNCAHWFTPQGKDSPEFVWGTGNGMEGCR